MKVDISIIIPVLNEQAGINLAVTRLHRQHYHGTLEIIVVDASPRGTTIGCIRDQNVIKRIASPGRGAQMNAGAQTASGQTLLFLHCDTRLPQNALAQVHRVMENPFVKAGAFDLSIDAKGAAFRLIEKTASLRSRITKIPYGDQSIFIRRAYFFEIGQYRDIPIMEDVDLMTRIKHDKARIQFVDSQAATSARRWHKEGLVYCTLRNWVILSLFFLGISPGKLAQFYKSK